MINLDKLKQATSSWKTLSIILLSFSSGLPLGLVWIAIPDALKTQGIEIQNIGLMALAQLPWSLKLLWAPLMDRYTIPLFGRRRGWIFVCQMALLLTTLLLATIPSGIDSLWKLGLVSFAIAFFSASQDIAIDGYAVELLNKEEQAVVVGSRIAIYRAAMYLAGSLSITLASMLSWNLVYAMIAMVYIPMMYVTWKSLEPSQHFPGPTSVSEAFFQPLKELLTRNKAIEILLFVIFYKLAENLGMALLRPFLGEMGYSAVDRGFALGTIGLAATLLGTFLGGMLTPIIGLGYSLWFFGALQIIANVGYIFLATHAPDRLIMYTAMGFECLIQGLGTGAFSVLLMRLTKKRFSITQYAVLSSLFSISRVFTGPAAGYLVKLVGWEKFFVLTMIAGIPGLLLLHRFSPWGQRDPQIEEM